MSFLIRDTRVWISGSPFKCVNITTDVYICKWVNLSTPSKHKHTHTHTHTHTYLK